MRLRTLRWLIALAVGLTVMSTAPGAQQPKRMPTVGILFNGTPEEERERTEAFRDGLRAVGYIDGQNIKVEYRFAPRLQYVPEMVSDLVRRNVDVIATSGALAIAAAKRATSTIPIVMIACDRSEHLVASIARPGGNVTGMTCISSDLAAKRLQLLREIVPTLSRVAVLYNPRVASKTEEVQATRAAAQAMGLAVVPVEVRTLEELEPAFDAMLAENPQALIGLLDPLTIAHHRRIVDLAADHRLPGIYG
jgi:putative ABC transport system substrate-binding protein